MKINTLTAPFRHPATQKARLILRRVIIVCAVILAVAVVTSVSVDVGPLLKRVAEEQGSRYIQRPMHIGRMEVRIWDGSYIVEDLRIDGLTPTSEPFLVAKRITVSNAWRTLIDRRFVLTNIEMSDWRMHIEYTADGKHNFPKFTRDTPRGQSRWTTTLQYVRAHRGAFTYQDFGTPWGIVARNIDVVVEKPGNGNYRGRADFTDGLVAIQNYVPFRTDMRSKFAIDDGRVVFERMELTTEGTHSELVGDANLRYWPELMLSMKSTIDFPKARELFFAGDTFLLTGTGAFSGHFHLFKEILPNGQQRTGRELKGDFHANTLGMNQYRFTNMHGDVRWTPEALAVTDATASVYGGDARFAYTMAPLNTKGVTPTASFKTDYDGINLATLSDLWKFDGITLAGRISGSNLLEWPIRRYSAHTGGGSVRFTPPDESVLMTREMPLDRITAAEARGLEVGPFSPLTPIDPVPIGGEIVYEYGPEWIDIKPSHIATPSTYVEAQGRTKYGVESDLLFHVSSADWQESDRVFAGVLTAFGSKTKAIPIGGYGTFDGAMTGAFNGPRIEGDFSGEQMRAWDVVWGTVRGRALIQNSYVDVTDVTITSGSSVTMTTGRYSLGFPRKDLGEEINAHIEIKGRPVADLRRAFGIEEYDIDGLLTGTFDLNGKYLEPEGSGRMEIANAIFYGEPVDTATSAVQLEGKGARLQNIQIVKGGGRGTGNAYIGLDRTYSFNFDARGIAAESITLSKTIGQPISALLNFSAAGSGTFDAPRYEVKGQLNDVFVADEGIGNIAGGINVNNGLMTVQLEAASPRLSVTVAGQISLPEQDADVTFMVLDTSLDPYVRLFLPQLSPYTTAVVGGSVRVVGNLSDIDNLLVDATVDNLDMRLFDYALRNARPMRLALDRHSVRIADMRIVGQDTQIDIAGVANLHDSTINMRANGDANLAVLQGFISDLRSSGTASLSGTLEGPIDNPMAGGTLTVKNGRIRHFALPHALENLDGPIRFDSRGLTLDGLTGRLGGGDVKFGGRVDKDGYLPGRFDVTMNGRDMRLRFPEGMRSLVDADLTLQGTRESAVLSGLVAVKDAVYTQSFNAAGSLFDFGTDPALGPAAAPTAETLPVRLDIRINAPSTLQVNNRNLHLVANADLQLRGTIERPVLLGSAEIVRGDATYEGKRFLITRGTVDFNNPTRIEPFLDIEAETRIRVPQETYRITLRVTGPLTGTPNFSFDSDPPLGEIEILALIFGDVAPGSNAELRQFDETTPQARLFRERAARALTGVLSSEVSRVVEDAFRVDTFQITPSLQDPNTQSARNIEPGMRLTVLKRLSERLYLTYSRSLTTSTRDQVVLLEFDQTDRLSWILWRNEDGIYALDWRIRKTF
ncbi:MAG TPA: translocation/assembly module TamB domain-containing protein [Vicinamibacterales bacterium]|nr:translocation/assembly module TamB domain-containing protein [Vicinamibacterales bacterium]